MNMDPNAGLSSVEFFLLPDHSLVIFHYLSFYVCYLIFIILLTPLSRWFSYILSSFSICPQSGKFFTIT